MSTEEKDEPEKKIILYEYELKELYKQSIEEQGIEDDKKEKFVKRFMELVNHRIH